MDAWTQDIVGSSLTDDPACYWQKAWHMKVTFKSSLISTDGDRPLASIKGAAGEESSGRLREISVSSPGICSLCFYWFSCLGLSLCTSHVCQHCRDCMASVAR